MDPIRDNIQITIRIRTDNRMLSLYSNMKQIEKLKGGSPSLVLLYLGGLDIAKT